jgi:hypothetical protein
MKMQTDEFGVTRELNAEIANMQLVLESVLQDSVLVAHHLGVLLEEAFQSCRHGAWKYWLKEHFPKSQSTAERYRNLAKAYPDPSALTNLSLREALRLLSKSKGKIRGEKERPTNEQLSRSTLESLHEHLHHMTEAVEQEAIGILLQEGVTDQHIGMKYAKRLRAATSRLRNYVAEQLDTVLHECFGNDVDHDLVAALGVLGLSWPVSVDEVKAAYRKLAKQCHPDAGGSQDEFKQLQAAYEKVMEAIHQAAAA